MDERAECYLLRPQSLRSRVGRSERGYWLMPCEIDFKEGIEQNL